MDTETLVRPDEGLGSVEQEDKNASPAVQRTLGLRKLIDAKIAKGKTRIYSERMTITPQMAQIMLERNIDNRRLRPVKLTQLKDDMNNDRFLLNGEPIIFAKTGELNDGQHRLQAIVETNKKQDIIVQFGLERSSRKTIDTGINRAVGDHLTMGGFPYGTQMAAIGRMCLAYERNKKTMIGRMGDISHAAVMERVTNDNLLQEAAAYCQSNIVKFKRFAKATIIGFCYYNFAIAKDEKIAKTFMEKLRNGDDLKSTSPIHVLREYLTTRQRLSTSDKLEVIIKAWNAWLNDTEIKQLRITGALPKIEG